MNATNDSADLEALFDSIASSNHVPAASAPAPAPAAAAPAQTAAAATASPEQGPEWSNKQENVFNRLGQMTRSLHDTLGQLGYDKVLEKSMSALPDTKDRLAYVANLTEQAACKVLNATDIAVPAVDQIDATSSSLAERWDKVFANQLSTDEFKLLASETRAFLHEGLKGKTTTVHAQLTEIMMAQDFQDLTGQVIKKIVAVAQELETNLMSVLLEVVPEKKKTDEVANLMQGPVINAEGRTDVVVNQEQVDDLLGSLGF